MGASGHRRAPRVWGRPRALPRGDLGAHAERRRIAADTPRARRRGLVLKVARSVPGRPHARSVADGAGCVPERGRCDAGSGHGRGSVSDARHVGRKSWRTTPYRGCGPLRGSASLLPSHARRRTGLRLWRTVQGPRSASRARPTAASTWSRWTARIGLGTGSRTHVGRQHGQPREAGHSRDRDPGGGRRRRGDLARQPVRGRAAAGRARRGGHADPERRPAGRVFRPAAERSAGERCRGPRPGRRLGAGDEAPRHRRYPLGAEPVRQRRGAHDARAAAAAGRRGRRSGERLDDGASRRRSVAAAGAAPPPSTFRP